MKGNRLERLSGEFQKEISSIIAGDLKNEYPELSTIISITEVDVAPDLKSARVYVSIYDKDEAKKASSFEIIKQNAGFIRRMLAKVMTVRTVPELRFHLDGAMEYGAKIDKIIQEIESKNNDK